MMRGPEDWGPIFFHIRERLGCHFGDLTLPQLRSCLQQIALLPGQPVLMMEPPKRERGFDL